MKKPNNIEILMDLLADPKIRTKPNLVKKILIELEKEIEKAK